jgi:hypothetical protein
VASKRRTASDAKGRHGAATGRHGRESADVPLKIAPTTSFSTFYNKNNTQ